MRRLFPDNTFVAPQMAIPSKDLQRIVIAEAPGEDEAMLGRPLVGGAGRWFDSMVRKAGLDREGLTIANCIQCRPPQNIFPTDSDAKKYISKEEGIQSVKHCAKAHLNPLLTSRKWKRVDLLGDKPLRLVAGIDGGVFRWRGSPIEFTVEGKTLKGIPTLHPAYIMRDQTMFPVAVNDLMKDMTIPEEFYSPYPSLEEVKSFKYKTFAFDIENPKYYTMGDSAPIEMIGLCAKPGFAICVPTTGAYLSELRRIFRDAEVIIGHNSIQFDCTQMKRKLGLVPNPKALHFDTMLLHHLVFPDFPHDLEFVGSQFVSKPAWKTGKAAGWQIYNCRDVDVTFQVFQQLKPLVEKNKLMELYKHVQVPMARICYLMFETGFKLNPNRIIEVREKLIKERDAEEAYLPEFLKTHERPCRRRQPAPPGTLGKSGKPVKFILVDATETVVPWRSPEVKKAYLYGTGEGSLGFPEIRDAKSGRVSTGKIALDKIFGRTKNRAVKALRILNHLDELITTFAKEDMVKLDRMHPHFNVHGTASGRLSSSDPNLQNIPESARFLYVPSTPGWKIVDVDYSQLENRLTAFFAGDRERLARFESVKGFSEHKYAASIFLGIDYEDVVKDNDKDAPYGKAKRIVHMTNYGGGARKIANMYDMDYKETKELQDKWKAAIKPTTAWQTRTAEDAKNNGSLTTPFGRKRWFYTSSYFTESLSFLPQSAGADIVFRAMIGLMYKRINWAEEEVKKIVSVYKPIPEPARLLLQVHDSLVFECPPNIVDTLIATVKAVMEQPWPELKGLSIPIGIEVGDSWGECEEYK